MQCFIINGLFETVYHCLIISPHSELEDVMQLFCSELVFNLTVLPQHVRPEYLLICLYQEPVTLCKTSLWKRIKRTHCRGMGCGQAAQLSSLGLWHISQKVTSLFTYPVSHNTLKLPTGDVNNVDYLWHLSPRLRCIGQQVNSQFSTWMWWKH